MLVYAALDGESKWTPCLSDVDYGRLVYLDFAQRIAAETVGEHVDEKARLLQRQGDSRAG